MDILVADGTRSERAGIKRILGLLNRCQSEFSFRYSPPHSALALEDSEFVTRASVAEIPSHIQSRQAASFWMAIVDGPLEDNWFSFVDKGAASSVIASGLLLR